MAANIQPESGGESSFVLNQFGDRSATIMFGDTTITWDASGKSVTFQIDGNPSFTAPAQTDTTHNILIVPLTGTPSTTMRSFMDELASGRHLLVTPSAGTPRTFALDRAQPALDAVGRCIAAMSSDNDRQP